MDFVIFITLWERLSCMDSEKASEVLNGCASFSRVNVLEDKVELELGWGVNSVPLSVLSELEERASEGNERFLLSEVEDGEWEVTVQSGI